MTIKKALVITRRAGVMLPLNILDFILLSFMLYRYYLNLQVLKVWVCAQKCSLKEYKLKYFGHKTWELLTQVW